MSLVDRAVVTRKLMQTHEARKTHAVFIEHAREICQESAIEPSEILRSELRLYNKDFVVNLQS